jgi:predicted RNase H-like HicB family nuclease
MAYGQTQAEAVAKVKALALRIMADRLEHGEAIPELKAHFSRQKSKTRQNFSLKYKFNA